jgi:hypothetical protein
MLNELRTEAVLEPGIPPNGPQSGAWRIHEHGVGALSCLVHRPRVPRWIERANDRNSCTDHPPVQRAKLGLVDIECKNRTLIPHQGGRVQCFPPRARARIDDDRSRFHLQERGDELAPFILQLEPAVPVWGQRIQHHTFLQPEPDRRNRRGMRFHAERV